MVLEIDEDRRRVSLGMKQCVGNPWQNFAQKHSKGQKVSGKIRSITDFGVFIGLDGEIDGLVHLSDISWTIPGEEAVKQYKKGQELEAVILAIDSDRERISLGLKQLDESQRPDESADAYTKGAVVTGIVSSVDPKVVMVTFADNAVGKIKVSDLSSEKVADATKVIAVGDEVEALVVSVDQKTKVVNLSIKAREANEQDEAMKKYAKGTKGPDMTTFGDLLKEKMKDNNND